MITKCMCFEWMRKKNLSIGVCEKLGFFQMLLMYRWDLLIFLILIETIWRRRHTSGDKFQMYLLLFHKLSEPETRLVGLPFRQRLHYWQTSKKSTWNVFLKPILTALLSIPLIFWGSFSWLQNVSFVPSHFPIENQQMSDFVFLLCLSSNWF